MVTKAQKVRLGIFLFISFALLVAFLFVIVGSRIMERLDTYYIAYEDVSVSGLQIGAQVKYHGIRVGRVESIRFDPADVNTIIVEIKIERGTPIKEDTEATLILTGITGLKQVELFGGTPASPLLEPGSNIIAGTTFFDDISTSIEEITTKLDRVLGNIDAFTGIENQEKFTNLLSNLEEVSLSSMIAVQRLEGIVNSPEVDQIISNAAKFSEDIAKVDLTVVLEELSGAIQQVDLTFTHIDLMVIRSRRDILLSLSTMKEAMDNLEEFSRQLSEDPTLILRRR